MSDFTSLERAVLQEICRQQGEKRAALVAQLSTATVARRENSGAGFFIYLSVNRATSPVMGSDRVLGRVMATVEGYKGSFDLMLFMEDGYADFLEGATTGDDDTTSIDLTTLRFNKNEPW